MNTRRGTLTVLLRRVPSTRRRAGADRLGAGHGVWHLGAAPISPLACSLSLWATSFGWSGVAAVQGALIASTAGVFLFASLYGRLCDRHGARRVALGSVVGIALGLICISQVRGGLGFWYAAWFVMAALGVGTTPITWTRGVASWFDRARGLALGLALMGSGLAGIFGPPIARLLIDSFGWRGGYLGLAAGVVLIALPVVWLCFHERPAAAVSTREATRPDAAAETGGVTARQALAGYRFWLMIAGFGLISFGVGGIIPNLVPLLTDKGLGVAEAAALAGAIGLSVLVGRVVCGFLLDRFWAPAVSLVFLSLPALSCVILAGSLPSPLMIAAAAALIGFAGGAEFDLVAFMVSRYFGMRSYGQIYAWQYMSFTLAAGVAPAIFGRVFDITGSYDPVLWTAAAGFVIGPLLMLGLGRYRTT